MNYNNQKKGISLIILVITVLIICILAAAVILNISKSNPIDDSKISKLLNVKVKVESNIKLYASKNLTSTDGKMKPIMTFTGKDETGKTLEEFDEESRADDKKISDLIITDTSVKALINDKKIEIYLLDTQKYIKEFDTKDFTGGLPNDKWYVDELGNIYLILQKEDIGILPNYFKNAINNNDNRIDFVYYLDGKDTETGLEIAQSIYTLD